MSAERYQYRTIRREELVGEKPWKRSDKKYPFCMPLRRLQYKNQISCLFDNPNKIKEKPSGYGRIYDGKIARITIRLYFSSKSTGNLCAKTRSALNKAHQIALDRLLENERNSIR